MAVLEFEQVSIPRPATTDRRGPVSCSDSDMSPRRPTALVSADSTDVELMQAIVARDEDALAEVYRRHGGAVFGLCSRLLADASLAEDITQELFLRLWNEPNRFDPARGALRSYLQRQAHSRSIERIRSEEARRRREERAQPSEVIVDDLEARVISSIDSAALGDAMSKLDPNDRQAIALAYFGGLSYREVAVRLGQPEGTIKSRIRSGLRRLSVLVGDIGDTGDLGEEVGR